MRTRTLVLIVAGAVVALSVVVVAVVGGAQLLSTAMTTVTTGPPIVEGEPGDPVAVDPLQCEERCFTGESVGAATSTRPAFQALGLPRITDAWGDYESTNAREEYEYSVLDWKNAAYSPNDCFFTYLGTPVAARFGEKPKANDLDLIEFTGTQTNEAESSSIWQSVRIFDSSDSAEQHMRDLDEQTRLCTMYQSDDYPPTTVTPAPALLVPDSVATIGWTESSSLSRYYVYDIQRGNLVVRSILSTWADEVSEEDFRVFVEDLAVSVSEITPAEPITVDDSNG